MAAINKKFAIEKGLEVGTETLVVDADTNKVAIGKTFAEYGLDVAPTSNFDGVVAVGNIGVGSTQPAYAGDFRGDVRFADKVFDSNVGAGSTGQVLISVGSGISWSSGADIKADADGATYSVQHKDSQGKFAGSNQLYYFSPQDRVGIGTAIPEYLLQVKRPVGSGSSNGFVQIGGTFLDAQGTSPGIGSVIGANDSGELTWVGAGATAQNILYVSERGDNNNDGRRESTSLKTIKAAAAKAVTGDVIRVAGGVFPEDNPISLPVNTTVDGDDLRNTQIIPLNTGKDLFHVDNGCLVQNMSFIGAANTGAMISYHPPRTNDNKFVGVSGTGTHIFVSGVTNALTASNGASGNFTAQSGTTYTPSTGELLINIGSHSLTPGNKITIADYGITFTCDDDNHKTTHPYPRPSDPASGVALNIIAVTGTTITVNVQQTIAIRVGSWVGVALTPSNIQYNTLTGVTTVTVVGHGLTVSDTIGFGTGSLKFTCKGDNNTSIKYYPRATDPIAGIFTSVNNVIDADNFVVNVGDGKGGNTYVGFITQSPYVRNCTNFVPNSIGMKIDGNDASNLKSMVVDSYTQYNQGGIGVSITNDGYAQLVSIFTNCDDIAIYCGSGGQCDLTNSNSFAGRLGLVSQGIGTVNYSGTLAVEGIAEDNQVVVGGLGTFRPYSGQAFYIGELFNRVSSVNMTSAGSGYTSSNPPTVTFDDAQGDGGIVAEGVAVVSGFGSVTAVNIFATGTQYRNTPNISIAAPTSGVTATATANVEPEYFTINSATFPTAGVSTITIDQTLPANVGVGSTIPFARQSLILASSHSFEYVGSGNTIGTALPRKGGVAIPANKTVSTEGGKVVFTSTDEKGNFDIGEDFTINQQTGTITGDAFNKSIQATLTPLIIALGG
tara:strand:- start:3047 stop:5722 length:2676 start_codon:yes stop_codon:yes gene_type:complete